MMKGSYKFGLTGARCLILCAAAALIGCAIYLFSVSQVEAALDRSWFPFAQLQALTAGMDGKTPESVCLVLAALPVFVPPVMAVAASGAPSRSTMSTRAYSSWLSKLRSLLSRVSICA